MTPARVGSIWKWEEKKKRGNKKHLPFFSSELKKRLPPPARPRQTPHWLRHSDWPWVICSAFVPLFLIVLLLSLKSLLLLPGCGDQIICEIILIPCPRIPGRTCPGAHGGGGSV